MNKPKFNLGDEVFFVQASSHYGTKEPCRVCFGKLKVAVILGNGESVDTECSFCQVGMERPSGQSTTWGADSRIHAGTVTGIRADGGCWRYEAGGYTLDAHELFATREEAVPEMEAKLKEVTERKKAYDRDHFITATKKQLWSAGYHRGRIADCERTIGWHKARLCMIEEKRPTRAASASEGVKK